MTPSKTSSEKKNKLFGFTIELSILCKYLNGTNMNVIPTFKFVLVP
jgi:hypothetical protein